MTFLPFPLRQRNNPSCCSCVAPPRRSHGVSFFAVLVMAVLLVVHNAVDWRRLVGTIISRFEQRGYKLTALKLKQADEALLKSHYK